MAMEMEMELATLVFPPGMRFMPTDVELIKEYLMNKILGRPLPCNIIQEADLSLFNPDRLACNYSSPGVEGVMYFFTKWKPRCNNSSRSSRQAGDGFWKATRSVAVMEKAEIVVGYKRVLKFHKGNPGMAEKTAWLMDEYRVDKADHAPATTTTSDDNSANPWFLCRIHLNHQTKKSRENTSTGPKKNHIDNSQSLQTFQHPPQPMIIFDRYHNHHQIRDYFDGPIEQTSSSGGNFSDHELMASTSASDKSLGYGQVTTTTKTHDKSCYYDQNNGSISTLPNGCDDDSQLLEQMNSYFNHQYFDQCTDQDGHHLISDCYDAVIDQTCTSGGIASTNHELTMAACVSASSNQSLGFDQLTTATSTHDQSYGYDHNNWDVHLMLNGCDDDLEMLQQTDFYFSHECLDQCPDLGPNQHIHDDGHQQISDYYDGPIDQTCTSGGISTGHELVTVASASTRTPSDQSLGLASSDQMLGYGQLTTSTSTLESRYDQNGDVIQELMNYWDYDVQYHEQMCIQDSAMAITADPGDVFPGCHELFRGCEIKF